MSAARGAAIGLVWRPRPSMAAFNVPEAILPIRRYCLLLAVSCLLHPLAGCERPPASQPSPDAARDLRPPIILITLDTVRADHLSCYGYFRETTPALAAFASEAVVFDRAYAPIATTLPSHASLLTGYEPLEHGILANIDDGGNAFGLKPGTRSLAELAKQAGYATAAFVSATPLKKAAGLSAGFDEYDEPDGPTRDGAETIGHALAWLQTTRQNPPLLWVHLYDPHFPYTPKPPLDTMFGQSDPDPKLESWIAERQIPERVEPSTCKGRIPTVSRTAANLYDGELRYTDDLVARIFAAVRESGRWDESLVIVVGDHGEGLNQHGWPQHGRIWNEQLHIPLLIKFPKAAHIPAARCDKVVGIVDVFPTVAGRLGWDWSKPLTAACSGRDVLAPDFRERSLVAIRSARTCPDDPGAEMVLITRDWRFHSKTAAGDALYSKDDPHELSSVIESKPGVADDLRKQLRLLCDYFAARSKDLDQGAPRPLRKMDEKMVRELESLGYTGGQETPEIP
ncbi:MAG: sulfatase [Planctomycetes bacterium]|nr:sulfatase [Planctomycetota bacterium]